MDHGFKKVKSGQKVDLEDYPLAGPYWKSHKQTQRSPESHGWRMGGHDSSWLSRAHTRALVTMEQKFGLEPKKARIVLVLVLVLGLLSVAYASSVLLGDESDGSYSSAVSSSSFSSESAGSSAGGPSASNLFADDGGGDDEEGEEEGGGGGGGDGGEDEGDEEEDEEGGNGGRGGKSAPSEDDQDDGEAEALKPKQLKLFQDKDKTLMKFFSKHRKDSEVAAHFAALEDLYKDLKLMKTVTIGNTYEKKTLLAYVIGKGKSGRGILVHATERGDEWIGNMALAYFATRLLQKYALTPAVTKVVNSLTIYLIPVANPDGLNYATSSSSKSHREWFMNRALNSDKKHGVDVSHDFEAFTQLETQAMKSFAQKNAASIHAFANVRCCGGVVSIPKVAMCSKADEQQEVAKRVAETMSKFGTYKYGTRFTDSDSNISPAFAFKDLGLALSFNIEAHPASSASAPGDIKTSDILGAAQNVTMGLMEVAKYVAVDFKRASVGLGGGGDKPCGSASTGASKSRGNKKSSPASEDDEDAEDEGDEKGGDESDDEEDGGRGRGGDDDEDSGGDDEGGKRSSSSVSAPVEDDRDHAGSFDMAKEGSKPVATNELEMSLSQTKQEGVRRPIPGVEIPNDQDGETFLYFAYGPDMLYDVMLKAGLTSAWKVVNARLTGYTFDYTYHSNKKWKSGVADIVKHSHGTVYGVVWRLDKLHMQTLLTWQSASTPTSPLAPKTVSVQDSEGRSYNCLTFYVVKKMKGEDILGKYHRFSPSRQYRNCIIKGAKAHHLPYDYVEHKLKSRSLAPLFTDKVGTTGHRNPIVGTVCDPLET